ncbi:IS1-like element transposase [Piscirickettsia salmonis]|uniref:IS1-like element transposase n=1 Tax=Piscirickettsia salmonis TaxID=1238 RepID=UPI0037538E45
MPHIEVNCPQCSENNVIKFGRNSSGNQRYKCKNTGCDKDTFLLNYKRPGDLPETKEKIIDMSMNGSGIRDIARVLKVSTNTVMKELKKSQVS